MSFTEGDTVVFKGDPEQETFEVNYVNGDGSVDLTTQGGSDWDYVPERLLEKAPEPVLVGDVYQGSFTQTNYYVVDRHPEGGFWVYDSNFEGTEALSVYQEKTFQRGDLYAKLRSGKDLQ